MNAFINSLFTLLFGWIRSLIQSLWNSIFSGAYHGFFSWLGDAWPWVVIVLCVGCTVLDYLVWLVRWRPYILWRQKLRSLWRRVAGKNTPAEQPVPETVPQYPADVPYQEPAVSDVEVPSEAHESYRYFPPETQPAPVQRHRRSQR